MLAVSHSRGADSDAPEQWNDLKGLWPLVAGGGGKGYDLSGYGNHGDWNGSGAHWAPSEQGTVGQCNGTDDGVNLGDWDSLAGGLFTISLEVYPTVVGGPDQRLLSMAALPGFAIGLTNELRVWRTTWHVIAPVNTVLANQWNHIAVRAETPRQVTGFVNGVRYVTEAAQGADYTFGTVWLAAAIVAGAYFAGLVRDVRTWSGPKTDSQIQHLYADCFASLRLRRKVFAVTGGGPFPHYTRRRLRGGTIGMGM